MELNNLDQTAPIKFSNYQGTHFFFQNNKYKKKTNNKDTIIYTCAHEKCCISITLDKNMRITNTVVNNYHPKHEPYTNCEIDAYIK